MCNILTNPKQPVKRFSQNNQIFASVCPSGALFPLRRELFLPAILPRLHKTPQRTREKIGETFFLAKTTIYGSLIRCTFSFGVPDGILYTFLNRKKILTNPPLLPERGKTQRKNDAALRLRRFCVVFCCGALKTLLSARFRPLLRHSASKAAALRFDNSSFLPRL